MTRSAYIILVPCALVLCSVAHPAHAQLRIGFQLSPTISYSRASTALDSVSVHGQGVAMRPLAALKFDFPLGDQYFLSTGVQYFSRPLKVRRQESEETSISEQYRIQHLQLPVMIKMLTSEFSIDKRFYAQLGCSADINIHEESSSDDIKVIRDFSPLALSLLAGAGVQFRLGVHTYLQSGLTYIRGLTNLVGTSGYAQKPVVKNDGFSIDIILLF
jgi:hypothetical protein